jgi:pyruvate ferredoxin oxidoreductase alpha subunit
MKMIVAVNGNTGVALAAKQVNPDVVAAYPITPQTIVMERFADFVADGEVDTELILTESEHSAMSACIGAAAAGARTFTSTASAGLAFMWEVLYIAASMRLPIAMAVMNRALSGPINIHCDHSDTMGARDSGWIQIFGENVQEGYDNFIQAFKIGEHENVRLPVMTMLDGFVISHSLERLEMLPDKVVKDFIGEYREPNSLLNLDEPHTWGSFALPDYFFEIKRQQIEAMDNSSKIIKQVGAEFGKLSGRKYGLIESYKVADADTVLVALGSTCGTIRAAVNEARKKGRKVGLLKIRSFRPFPNDEVAKVLAGKKMIAVFDRSVSFGGFGGPLFTEVRSALMNEKSKAYNFIYGLGGRDITTSQILQVISNLKKGLTHPINYVGLRE